MKKNKSTSYVLLKYSSQGSLGIGPRQAGRTDSEAGEYTIFACESSRGRILAGVRQREAVIVERERENVIPSCVCYHY